MDCPLVQAYGVQAVIREVNTLADAHAGMAQQQEGTCGKVVAPYQLLLQKLILFCGERAGQTLWHARNILAPHQVSEFGKLVCPSQLVQNGAQSDEASDAGCGGQRWGLRAHARHPSKDVRIALQLFEAGNPGVFGTEIDKEIAHRDVVVAFGGRTERGGEGLNSTGEARSQRMLERRTAPTLD